MNEFDRQLRKFAKTANAMPEEIERVSEAARHVTEEALQTYALQILCEHNTPAYSMPGFLLVMDRLLRETEENLTDLLPEGYSVRIREWDEEETPNV